MLHASLSLVISFFFLKHYLLYLPHPDGRGDKYKKKESYFLYSISKEVKKLKTYILDWFIFFPNNKNP